LADQNDFDHFVRDHPYTNHIMANLLEHKELPVGNLLRSESFSSGIIQIPYSFIPEVNLKNYSEVINGQSHRFRFQICGRSFWVNLFMLQVDYSKLLREIQQIFRNFDIPERDQQTSMADLIYHIDQQIYSQDGFRMNYLLQKRFHDVTVVFSPFRCVHQTLEQDFDRECTSCIRRNVSEVLIYRIIQNFLFLYQFFFLRTCNYATNDG
jgi:hypothetical protein